MRNSLRRISQEGLKACSSELVPAGSIVVTTRAPVGNVALAETELCTNQGCKSLVTEDTVLSPVFGLNVLNTLKEELQGLATGTTFAEISTNRLGSLRMPLPPLPEQTSIVRFLNFIDRRIRKYIRAKQKLINLLEEQKQAIIHRAVTRGLDPNVCLKPSGVEWLGDVPEYWTIQRIKHVSRILRGKFSHRPRNDPSLYDGPYPFIQTGEVARAGKMIEGYQQTLNEDGFAISKMFPSGTLVMTIAANIGDVAVLNFEACFPDSVVGFVPNKNIERDYLYYVFCAMKSELLREAPVNTQGNLNIERVGSRKIALPPLQEQQEIIKYIEDSLSSQNVIIASLQREIELLREYRIRLIADVVTGKLDVREAAAWLPDEADEPELIDETEELVDNEPNDTVEENADAE